MKRILSLVFAFIVTGMLSMTGIASAWSLFPEKANPIERDITKLMVQHQKYMDRLFSEINSSFVRDINSFDKTFYVDIRFLNDAQAVNFFNNIESSLEKGVIPRNNGMISITYSKYVDINGRVTGVNYNYDSNGKNVTLIKSTDENGKTVKAVYQYDIKGRRLDVKEFKGKNLVEENVQKLI